MPDQTLKKYRALRPLAIGGRVEAGEVVLLTDEAASTYAPGYVELLPDQTTMDEEKQTAQQETAVDGGTDPKPGTSSAEAAAQDGSASAASSDTGAQGGDGTEDKKDEAASTGDGSEDTGAQGQEAKTGDQTQQQ